MARARLRLEVLEQRRTPAAFNIPWPEIGELSLSFAPDGTRAGTNVSSLFQSLDRQQPTSAWQTEILRAFQTWAVQSNINVGLVSDGGEPFDTLGLKQGDPRFGDVRIGADSMAADVLAVANPYDPFVANTWVGDVFLNAAVFGSATSAYDLYSVMLHEAGHVFGLAHSPDPASPMFEHFHPNESTLTGADITALQALYGVRHADSFEGVAGNDTIATATPLSLTSENYQVAITADITARGDKDTFGLTIPGDAQGLDIHLHAKGISLLAPRMTVFDGAGNVVDANKAMSPLDNDVVLHLDRVKGGQNFYIQIEGARDDVFGIGRYDLQVSAQTFATKVDYKSSMSTQEAPAFSFDGIKPLATTPGYVEHTYYEVADNLSLIHTQHTYQVRSVDLGPNMTNVMTVVAYAPAQTQLALQVSIFDGDGNPVTAETIAKGSGTIEVQVPSVLSNQDYFVQVSSAELTAQEQGFEVEVDFDHDASRLGTLVNESLAGDAQEVVRTLHVNQSQQFHWVLSASDWSKAAETGVQMDVFDPNGRRIYTLDAADGTSRSGDVFLNEGEYTVRFSRANDGSRLPLIFQLSGLSLSSPIGPQLKDTTGQPVESAGIAPPPSFFWSPYTPTGQGTGLRLPASHRNGPTAVVLGTPASAETTRAEIRSDGFVPSWVEPAGTAGLGQLSDRAPSHVTVMSPFEMSGHAAAPFAFPSTLPMTSELAGIVHETPEAPVEKMVSWNRFSPKGVDQVASRRQFGNSATSHAAAPASFDAWILILSFCGLLWNIDDGRVSPIRKLPLLRETI